MTADPRNLTTPELCDLLNSTERGRVLTPELLRRHAKESGSAFAGSKRGRWDVYRYVAWLALQAQQKVIERPVSGADLARSLKITRQQISLHAKAGMPVADRTKVGRPLYVPSVCREWIDHNVQQTGHGGNRRDDAKPAADPAKASAATSLNSAKAAREWIAVEESRLELRRRKRELAETAEYDELFLRFGVRVKDLVERETRKAGDDLGAMLSLDEIQANAVRARMRQMLEAIRTELAINPFRQESSGD